MKKIRTCCTLAWILLALIAVGTIGTAMAYAEETDTGGDKQKTEKTLTKLGTPDAAIYYAIAITVAVGCLSAGYAVGKVGAAALGAAAERPELLGRAIIFVGLAEGIAIYGLIIGIMLIREL